MKKMKLAALALSLVGVFSAGNALAANTNDATILVTAEISASCSITRSTNIAFGAIDPLAATTDISPATPGSVTVKCTEGTTVDFSSSTYIPLESTTAADLNYTPVLPLNGQTPGFAGATYAVSATIALADVQNAEEANDYSGSFVVNILY